MSLNNELPKIPRVNRIFLATVLLLTAIPAWKLFATLPTQGVVMDQVIPPEARPGDAVVVTGYALDAAHIEDVFLVTEDDRLNRVEILAESGNALRFRVPLNTPAGPARIVVKQPMRPGLIDQMIYLKVLDPLG